MVGLKVSKFHWYFSRPHDTPFEDGTFKLTIEFTEEYPNKPPSVRFISKMFHPNGKCKLLVGSCFHADNQINIYVIKIALRKLKKSLW